MSGAVRTKHDQHEPVDLRRYLSPTISGLADAIGIDKALALSVAFGGVQIYVPLRPNASHPISQIIGQEAAIKLGNAVRENDIPGTDGVGRLWIPQGASINRALKVDEIRAAVAGGMSRRQAALRFSVSNRWVRMVCNAKRGAT